jgi:4-aminobutyrate aminotransferase-like enzyme
MRGLTEEQVLELRRKHFAPNLSLSFADAPLCVLRGHGTYLYTADGRAILDCVNNVAHVGHSHPRVASAAFEQLMEINTNTRYLSPTRVIYAQKLLETFPPGLSVVFLVNSGSEANDLALRLARAYTKQEDVIVLGSAYHGHTTLLIEISPYKFEGRGGFQPRPWVHKAQAPDTFRGPHTGPDAHEKYAQSVRWVDRGLERLS